MDTPLDAQNTILEAYMSLLQAQGKGDLVALYAGAFGEIAVEKYAMYLARECFSVYFFRW